MCRLTFEATSLSGCEGDPGVLHPVLPYIGRTIQNYGYITICVYIECAYMYVGIQAVNTYTTGSK